MKKSLMIIFLLSFVAAKSYPDIAKKQPPVQIKTFRHYLPATKCLRERQEIFSILSQTAERIKDVLISPKTNPDEPTAYAEGIRSKPPYIPP